MLCLTLGLVLLGAVTASVAFYQKTHGAGTFRQWWNHNLCTALEFPFEGAAQACDVVGSGLAVLSPKEIADAESRRPNPPAGDDVEQETSGSSEEVSQPESNGADDSGRDPESTDQASEEAS